MKAVIVNLIGLVFLYIYWAQFIAFFACKFTRWRTYSPWPWQKKFWQDLWWGFTQIGLKWPFLLIGLLVKRLRN